MKNPLRWPVIGLALVGAGTWPWSGAAALQVQEVRGVGVYAEVERKRWQGPALSVFLAGYLSNVKGYDARSLDQPFVVSEEAARLRAVELGLDAVLVARSQGFRDYGNSSAVRLRLVDTRGGEILSEWETILTAPYFDPPTYRNIEQYGNLEEVLGAFPEVGHRVDRTIAVLVVSDQRLRGSGKTTRIYLEAQLEIAARVLRRDFGVDLAIQRIRRWSPPAGGITAIAGAAAAIPGRDAADLTLVCIGPPAPYAYDGEGPFVLGFARVLTNVVVNRVMNAHVFVHEIAHVLGAIHVDDAGCIMQAALARPELAGRFEVVPPVIFSATNRRIIDITRHLPLGTDFEGHREKVASLMAVYDELAEVDPAAVGPYYAGLLLNLNETAAAIELLRAGMEADPNDLVLRSMLGEALSQAGRYGEAQELVQEEFDLRQAYLKEATNGGVRLKQYGAIHLSRTIVAFRDSRSGERQSETVTIVNQGTGILDIDRFGAIDDPFSLGADETPFSIGPGASVGLEIYFTPNSGGLHQGTLEVFSNARERGLVEVRLRGRAE